MKVGKTLKLIRQRLDNPKPSKKPQKWPILGKTALEKRRKEVTALRNSGLGLKEIGIRYNISYQRVAQILDGSRPKSTRLQNAKAAPSTTDLEKEAQWFSKKYNTSIDVARTLVYAYFGIVGI